MDEVSFMKISYVTYASLIKILKMQKFPEREAPKIQFIEFQSFNIKLHNQHIVTEIKIESKNTNEIHVKNDHFVWFF